MAAPSTHTDQVWASAIPPALRSRVDPRPRPRRALLDDISVAICLLVLLAVVLIGGVVALFSAVTTVLPRSETVACRTLEACVEPGRDTGEAVWFDPERLPEVQPTR